MTTDAALNVESGLAIPRHELAFRATRSGGPGGQHVNTSSTRVELYWNLERSRALSEDQRRRLREKLAARVDSDGNVRVVASAFRSQLRNRLDAEQRLAALLRRSLATPKARKKTRPTHGSIERRLEHKRKLAEKKRTRSAEHYDD